MDALTDKTKLSMVAEALHTLEPHHFPVESRQPIITKLYEFNLVRMAKHYTNLFGLPLPLWSWPLLPNSPALTAPPPKNLVLRNDNNNNGNAIRTEMCYDLIRLTISPSRK